LGWGDGMVFQPMGLNAFQGGIGPFLLRSVFKRTFASTDAFDPLAFGSTWDEPTCIFYRFTCLFFNPTPFGPTSRVR